MKNFQHIFNGHNFLMVITKTDTVDLKKTEEEKCFHSSITAYIVEHESTYRPLTYLYVFCKGHSQKQLYIEVFSECYRMWLFTAAEQSMYHWQARWLMPIHRTWNLILKHASLRICSNNLMVFATSVSMTMG